ncbi:MAG: amidohydrolase family protein [Opitutaceae bacterium]|nr:amidohydrolase family protein [Opitutaceae bacterium]
MNAAEPRKSCPPPDPNTRTPKFKAPPKACDAHCHIFGPKHIFPYHPNSTYEPPDAGKDRLKALHRTLGIERAVFVQASCHGPDNRAMLDAIASSNGAYRGVCIAKKTFTDAEFQQLHDGGVRGVRFNFVTHLGGTPDLDAMKTILARVAPLGWHLVIHVNAEDIITFEDFFTRIEMDIVVDHMGRVHCDQGTGQRAFQILKTFMRRQNWWCKICGAERISRDGPPFHDAVPFARELIGIAPERILWGTDFPHPNITRWMPNDGDLLDLLPLFADDPALQKTILVDNPARLYGFAD